MDNKATDLKRVRYLATQLYMLFLKEKSGGLSFGSIEKHFKKTSFQTKQEYWDNHTGAFYKYARGSVKIKDQKLIDRIEENEQYQGGKYILNHPLWLILENPSATLDNVHEYMRLLPPNIQSRLFKLNKTTNQFERNYWNKSEHLSRISKLNNLDALACFLMLVREMELLKKWYAYVRIKWCAHDLFIRLSYLRPLSELHVDLYELIYAHFIAKHNPITANYFSGTNQVIFKHFYSSFKSPLLISDFKPYHEFLNQIITHANKVMTVGEAKEEQLNFLFWVFELDLIDIYDALQLYDGSSKTPFIIQRLINACSDSNTRKYLRNSEIFTFLKI